MAREHYLSLGPKEYRSPATIGEAVTRIEGISTRAAKQAVAVSPTYLLGRFGGLEQFRMSLPPVISTQFSVGPLEQNRLVSGVLFGADAIRMQGRPERLDDWRVDAGYSLWHGNSDGVATVSLGIRGYPGEEDHVFSTVEGQSFIFHTALSGSRITATGIYTPQMPIWGTPVLRDGLRRVTESLVKSEAINQVV